MGAGGLDGCTFSGCFFSYSFFYSGLGGLTFSSFLKGSVVSGFSSATFLDFFLGGIVSWI